MAKYQKKETTKQKPTTTKKSRSSATNVSTKKKTLAKKGKKSQTWREASTKQEELLNTNASKKFNLLDHCDHHDDSCPCQTPSSAKPIVDLIILIDTSSSMYSKAQSVSSAAELAIKHAAKKCPTDLSDRWLGVDTAQNSAGTTTTGSMPSGWPPGTKFLKTHEEYLISDASYTGPFAHDQLPSSNWPHEQGADAITDLSKHYNWRKGACRAIFYISDTNLDALARDANEDVAINNAINAANSNNVTIFAHYIGNDTGQTPIDYRHLTQSTGGDAFVQSSATTSDYVTLLEEVICNACGGCTTVNYPKIAPCISIGWGDSECDCLETDDLETLFIKVSNCYSNVHFSNFIIGEIELLDAGGNPVPILPDLTPSVEVVPGGPICFGDLNACVDNKPQCKSREVVLSSRGAAPGDYQLKLKNIRFDVINTIESEECFTLPLCKDR